MSFSYTTIAVVRPNLDPDLGIPFSRPDGQPRVEMEFNGGDTEVEPGETVTLTMYPVTGEPRVYPNAVYEGFAADGSIIVVPNDEVSGFPDITASIYLTNNFPEDRQLPEINTTDPFVCFAAGTMIATPAGDVAVETLRPGDVLRTADGGTARVRWLGHQTRSTLFAPAERICPVRIAAGALAPDVPAADLTVTADHGIVFDEAIVHAGALVNGTTITRVPKADLPERVTFYHIETEGHAVVVANGCPAETFIDNVARSVFDNHAEFEAAFGAEAAGIEPLGLPRAKGARQVPQAIRARIAARVAELAADMAEAV